MQITDFIVNRTLKKTLIARLGISPQCFFDSYLPLAEQCPDFLTDYPLCDGQHFKRIGLTDYQVWVVQMIFSLVQSGLPKRHIAYKDEDGFYFMPQEIEQFLSKENYLKSINQSQSVKANLI